MDGLDGEFVESIARVESGLDFTIFAALCFCFERIRDISVCVCLRVCAAMCGCMNSGVKNLL
jgi:hypothetical protein